jgi:hypothetical protein
LPHQLTLCRLVHRPQLGDSHETRRPTRQPYEQLAEKLEELDVHDTAVNLRNKVARGGFSAVFFLLCLAALECRGIDFPRLGVGVNERARAD